MPRTRCHNQHNFIKEYVCLFSYVVQRKKHTCSLPADLLKNLFQVFTVSFVSFLHHALTTDTDENNEKDRDGQRQYDKGEKKPRKMRPWPRLPRFASQSCFLLCFVLLQVGPCSAIIIPVTYGCVFTTQ